MIDPAAVTALVSQYERFGWRLDHVVLSSETKSGLGPDVSEIFRGVPIADSDIDGLWFTRPAANGRIAAELRSLGGTPFALVDSVSSDAQENEWAEAFQRTESRLRERSKRS